MGAAGISERNHREPTEYRVAQHYARSDLEQVILDALVASGKDVDRLTPADLSPVDEFHTGGAEATIAFAAEVGFTPDMHVLDVGCGIGGPSRYFAAERRCRVTGIVASMEEYRGGLEAAGFGIVKGRDRGDFARAFFRQVAARAAEQDGLPPLGIHILMKQDIPEKLRNYVSGLEAGAIAPIELVCRAL